MLNRLRLAVLRLRFGNARRFALRLDHRFLYLALRSAIAVAVALDGEQIWSVRRRHISVSGVPNTALYYTRGVGRTRGVWRACGVWRFRFATTPRPCPDPHTYEYHLPPLPHPTQRPFPRPVRVYEGRRFVPRAARS